MPIKPQSVSTAADELFELVKNKKEISFKEAAQKLKVPLQTIEAWATFLEEDRLLAVKYKLTTPYLALPLPDKAKKTELNLDKDKLFLYNVEEAEVKAEFEESTELIEAAAERRKEGEFGMLGNMEAQILSKLRKIIGFLASKVEISPQEKAGMADILAAIEKKIQRALDLARQDKFNEASNAYSEIHSDMRKLLEKTRRDFEAKPESFEGNEEDIKKLLERTYQLLEQGKADEAEQSYEKLKRMFAALSQKFRDEKSELQDGIIKLNRDLAIKANKIRQQQMAEGMMRISSLLKQARDNIAKRQFNTATACYLEIKKAFEGLPPGFAKGKRSLKEAILKVFEDIAREREARLKSRFAAISKSVADLLKEIDKHIAANDLSQALAAYRQIEKLYADLPSGFLKEKFEMHRKILAAYSLVSQRLETTAERSMAALTASMLNLIAAMKQQVSEDRLEEASQTYSRINDLFARLPEGFVEAKTELQEKIIDVYEELLGRKDQKKDASFRSSVNEIQKMIGQAHASVGNNMYPEAYALYKRIKRAYIQLQPLDVNERQSLRNSILTLYRSILLLRNQRIESAELQLPKIQPAENKQEIHDLIESLKAQSKAQVKLPQLQAQQQAS